MKANFTIKDTRVNCPSQVSLPNLVMYLKMLSLGAHLQNISSASFIMGFDKNVLNRYQPYKDQWYISVPFYH